MTLRGATFLGVGSMVGAGIFALLGEAAAVAGAATWVSFLLAGCVTGLLGYTIAKLGVRYPSSGGFIAYLKVAYGNGDILGIAAWMGFFALVITAAMVAVSFGEYASSLLLPDDAASVWIKVFATVVIVVMTAVNVRGSSLVDKAQSVIVVVVLGVFSVFFVSTLGSIDSSNLAPSTYPAIGSIVSSIALTFFAFLGFSVITFSAGDLEDPPRQLPRAMYLAIGITTLTYVLISIGVFGVLSVDQVIASGPTAIAEAARPALGDFGFTLMSITAMFATAGCTNANLYGASHLTEMLGKIEQFPPSFAHETKRGRPGGLMITAAAVLLMANLFDITAIASIGTTIALILFLLLCGAGIRLRHETGAHMVPMLAAVLAIVVVLALFLIDTIQSDPATAISMVAIIVLAVACNFGWKYLQQRGHRDDPAAPVASR